ncbi:MAG: molybdenum cofactor guanylyltransferase [Actinomycetota bacterium]
MSHRQLSVAVLAGGLSTRMGEDKASLPLEGGLSLVDRVCERLAIVSDDVFVVSKQPREVRARLVLDETPEQSPLAGIIAALRAAEHPFVFVCGCDMPYISYELVAKLVDRAEDYEVAVPTHEDRIQSLHGVWAKACLPKLEAQWATGERAVFRAMQRLDTYIVNANGSAGSFTNINSPEEFEALKTAPIEPTASTSS